MRTNFDFYFSLHVGKLLAAYLCTKRVLCDCVTFFHGLCWRHHVCCDTSDGGRSCWRQAIKPTSIQLQEIFNFFLVSFVLKVSWWPRCVVGTPRQCRFIAWFCCCTLPQLRFGTVAVSAISCSIFNFIFIYAGDTKLSNEYRSHGGLFITQLTQFSL